MDRARDLQIFSLMLSQLSYPRNVVRTHLRIRVVYINFLTRLTVKEVALNCEYHAPRKYRFIVSFLLVQDHEQLFHTFRGVWMLVSLLVINHISNMLHTNDLIFTQKYISI